MAGARRRNTGASVAQSRPGDRRSLRTEKEELSTGPRQEAALESAHLLADDRSVAAASSETVGISALGAHVVQGEAEPARLALSLPGSASEERSTCNAGEEDDDSDASTTASVSEPPPESPRVRWADLADSDEDEEEAEASGSSSLPAPAWAAPEEPAVAKARWADIVDSEEEEQAAPLVDSLPQPAQQGGSSPSRPPATSAAQARNGAADEGRTAGPAAAPTRGASRGWGEAVATARRPERRERRAAAAWSDRSGAGKAGGAGKAASSTSGQWQHAETYRTGARNGAGWSQAGRYSRPAAQGKRQCQFMIGIEEEPQFQVKQKILGRHGQNVKSIFEKSGAKLRLRGRGSGFLEGPEQIESSDPLMLCISAPDTWAYREAYRLVSELLEGVHGSYRGFCARTGRPAPDLHIEVHEGPRPGSF